MNMKSMASSSCCLSALLLIAAAVIATFDPLNIVGCVNAQIDDDDTPVTAMFVFGDSYADTGNSIESLPPVYGRTWPGYPAGRWSDGMILTDYIASIINIRRTPAPYTNWTSGQLGCNDFTSGTNFAHGGTGVFRTAEEGPTLSEQIDQFLTFSDSCPNIKILIPSSVALVVMVGNDYITYLVEHLFNLDWKDLQDNFMPTVVNGIIDSITRLYDIIGFRKFAIANLEPAGCTPFCSMMLDYTDCIQAVNDLSHAHNSALSEGIKKIHADRPEMKITILNQTDSFPKAQKQLVNHLKPCIECKLILPAEISISILNQYENYHKLLIFGADCTDPCLDPENYFFWDPIHPTQAGWKLVTDVYKDQIHELINGIQYNGKSLA